MWYVVVCCVVMWCEMMCYVLMWCVSGKSYVEKGKVVRNYYRHGSYEVALQHYKFIPVIKVGTLRCRHAATHTL